MKKQRKHATESLPATESSESVNTTPSERSRPLDGGRSAWSRRGIVLLAANIREWTRIRDCGQRVAIPLLAGGN